MAGAGVPGIGTGGATPTIVPLSLLGPADGTAPVAGRGAPGPPTPGGAAGAAGAPGGAGGGAAAAWFIINIVPLNFGAAAPFKWKLHLLQVGAVSGFCVPQFGQNTSVTSSKCRLLRNGSGTSAAPGDLGLFARAEHSGTGSRYSRGFSGSVARSIA